MDNITFDIAKNYSDENEYILLYKLKGVYRAISIRYSYSRTPRSVHLGEFYHLVEIPTSWILLSHQWEQEIEHSCIVNEIRKQMDLLK